MTDSPHQGRGSRQAVFFDLDGTLLARSSVMALARPLRDAGLIRPSFVARGIAAQMLHFHTGGRTGARERLLGAALQDLPVERLCGVLDNCLKSTLAPLVHDGALDLLSTHRQAGRRLYLVSSAPEEVVTRTGAMLGVDRVLATKLESHDGVYTGRVGSFCQGGEKAKVVRVAASADRIDLAASYAYADSISDLPMLEAVGHPYVVNPDRELARVAKRHGWEIIHLQ
ncbi:MAG: HAD family hydrolase [Acidimicrobiales bacterium]